jgi:hypothetical protein
VNGGGLTTNGRGLKIPMTALQVYQPQRPMATTRTAPCSFCKARVPREELATMDGGKKACEACRCRWMHEADAAAVTDVETVLASSEDYDPLRESVREKAVKMSAKRAADAAAEWTFYRWGVGAGEGEFWVQSPNLRPDGKYPYHSINIITGFCSCEDYDTRIRPMNDRLEEYGIPGSLTCRHPYIIAEKLANGCEPDERDQQQQAVKQVAGFASREAFEQARKADFGD